MSIEMLKRSSTRAWTCATCLSKRPWFDGRYAPFKSHLPLPLRSYSNASAVRVRFAPSPTGHLHLGGLRTALYNYLLARSSSPDSKLILRIEDTDRARLVDGAAADLVNTCSWAGINFDEGSHVSGEFGPYTQSERLHIYHDHVNKLIETGHAYRCFCDAPRLDSLRKAAMKQGSQRTYDRHCYYLSENDIEKHLAANHPHVVRFKAPDQVPPLNDLVYGQISSSASMLDDIVLLKSDSFPTYHLASVVDDHLMQVTHVLRGEEWLPSLPKHIALYQAFGWQPPSFAHVPLLMNPDGSKLSKRSGDVTVQAYIDKGYEPEALLNYVALLGWHPSRRADGSEVLTLDELIAEFDIKDINKSKATVMPEKLEFLNRQHILQKMDSAGGQIELLSSLKVYLNGTDFSDDYLLSVLHTMKERIYTIKDIPTSCSYFFTAPSTAYVQELLRSIPESSMILSALRKAIQDLSELNADGLTTAYKSVAKEVGLKTVVVINVLRYAITGMKVGAGVVPTAMTLGKAAVLERIQAAQTVQK